METNNKMREVNDDWGTVCLVAGEMLNTSMHDIDAEHIYCWANRLLMLAENNIDETSKTEGGVK